MVLKIMLSHGKNILQSENLQVLLRNMVYFMDGRPDLCDYLSRQNQNAHSASNLFAKSCSTLIMSFTYPQVADTLSKAKVSHHFREDYQEIVGF